MMTKHTLQKVLLASTIAIGSTAIWVVLGGHIVESLPILNLEPSVWDAVLFLKDGTPLITRYTGGQEAAEYRNVAGEPVSPPLDGAYLTPAYLSRSWGIMGSFFESPRLTDGQASSGYWYLLRDLGSPELRGYFVGYDSHTRRRIGYLGINGFQESIPSREQMFPGVSRGEKGENEIEKGLYYIADNSVFRPYLIGSTPRSLPTIFVPTIDGKLYVVDIQQQTVKLVHEGDPVRSARMLTQPMAIQGWPVSCVALRTDAKIITLDAIDGHVLKQFPIPTEFQDSDFQFALTSTSEMILELGDTPDSLRSTNKLRIIHVRADGTKEDHTLELAQNPSGRRFQANGGIFIPAPLFLAGTIAFDRGLEIVRNHLEATWSATVKRLFTEYGRTFLMCLGLSVACAMSCFVRLSRYSASRAERVFWPVFVLLLGPPGWFGFRFSRSWPVLDTCLHCKARVPMNHEECVACNTEFPLPAKLGTEVFA